MAFNELNQDLTRPYLLCHIIALNLNGIRSPKYICIVISLNQIYLACSYRVEEPPGLVELQTNEWEPVMNWIEQR